ncbi:MAG: hypothetical protein JKY43_06945 [Phycisphaerales bacterium]|nr:hypothetical protein [Phycisphaerales bacterium]
MKLNRSKRRITGTRTLAFAVAAGLSVAMVGGVGGCKERKRMGGLQARFQAKKLAHTVKIDGIPMTIGQFTAVDIVNPSGDVEIRSHSKHEKAYVEFKIRKEQWLRFRMAKQGIEFDPVGDYFTAEYIVPEGSLNQVGTLMIRPTDLSIEGFRPPIDVLISIPRCDGAKVSTSNGRIMITGVTGTIEVRNGDEFTEGGDIIIRTGENPIEEVMAYTSKGDVHFIASPSNTGVFDLSAPRGSASFSSKFGWVDHSMPSRGSWTGIWNDGTNAISLHSENGDTEVFVTEQPRFYRP